MKLMSGGDGVILRCEKLKFLLLVPLLGWFFRHIMSKCHRMDPYYVAWKALAKTHKKRCKHLLFSDPSALRIVI